MRKLWGILAVGALGFVTTQAEAAPVAFTGSLSISIAGRAPVGIPGAGAANLTTNGNHIGTLTIPGLTFAVAGVSVPMGDPGSGGVQGLQVTLHNGAGDFHLGGGMMPINGVSKVCLFAACGSGPPGNLSIPLSVVGAGGAQMVNGLVNLTLVGAPWTFGAAAVGTVTQMGFQHGPASGTSSTVAASGAIRLVTPIFISTNVGSAVVPGFGFLNMHFVPEPGTLLLLGSGIAGLLMLARAKHS